MNIDKLPANFHKWQQTERYLGRACYRFADVLAGGAWHDPEKQSVSIERKIDEVYGEECEASGVMPIEHSLSGEFTAYKQELIADDGTPRQTFRYEVSTAVSQRIEASDIAEATLDEIFNESGEEDDSDDEFTRDDLDEVEIFMQEVAGYDISEYGEIEGYSLTTNYFFDNEEVLSRTYDTTLDAPLKVPVRLADGTTVDSRPLTAPTLTERVIADELAKLDDIELAMQRQVEEDTFAADLEYGSQSREEHVRRAIGMLAVVSSGLVRQRLF